MQYTVSVQTPQYSIDTIDSLRATPISTGGKIQTVGNLTQITRTLGPANITHFNVARTFDVQASVDGTDLGSVSDAVEQLVASALASAPPGTRIASRARPRA